MSKLFIEGCRRLSGAVTIHGAKNSALPILAASLMADGVSEIQNCPGLSDVDASVAILRHLGCKITREGHRILVDNTGLSGSDIPDDLMREMRSSIVFLGAIAAKTGAAVLSFPGGCELGPRPIDLHLAALRQLGMVIEEERGQLRCRVKDKLKGCTISLAFPSVGATENILLAAATATGTTTILNAAREPEIEDLCAFLNSCGARIQGAGEGTIVIEGVERLRACCHRVIPDPYRNRHLYGGSRHDGRFSGDQRGGTRHVAPVFPAFEEMGCQIDSWKNELLISAPARLRRVRTIRTMPYPGFPTDSQALLMAMACVADGTSVFIENIFESRYKHAGELMRLGAKVKVEGRVAVVEGVPVLSGAPVECTDLRGGAALVLAGLAAEGETTVTALHHIDRGYEALVEGLAGTGAAIRRED